MGAGAAVATVHVDIWMMSIYLFRGPDSLEIIWICFQGIRSALDH